MWSNPITAVMWRGRLIGSEVIHPWGFRALEALAKPSCSVAMFSPCRLAAGCKWLKKHLRRQTNRGRFGPRWEWLFPGAVVPRCWEPAPGFEASVDQTEASSMIS